MKNEKFRTLNFPKLDLLSPSIESNLFKMTEELGEVCAEVGKHRGLNGETIQVSKEEYEVLNAIAKETLDVMQSCSTMLNLLESMYGVDIDSNYKEHVEKLVERKYVSEEILDLIR